MAFWTEEQAKMCYDPLDPAFKQRWIDALLSGQFHQAEGALRVQHDDGQMSYCCLGVACELMDNTRWGESWRSEDFTGALLSDWAHVPARSTGLPFIDHAAAELLAETNDSGCTFPDIADWIKENL